MSQTADTAPPVLPTYSVTQIRPAGNALYELTVQTPDGSRFLLLMTYGETNMVTVRLAAQAAAMLWATKLGATPLAKG